MFGGVVRKFSGSLAASACLSPKVLGAGLLVLALATGPVFFSYALFVALYKALPQSSATVGELALAEKSARADLPTEPDRLRPLSPQKTISTKRAGGADYVSETPVRAYRRLRKSAADVATRDTQRPDRVASGKVSHRSETYKTVCVRLCDGYYFPIGRNVPRKHLGDHEDLCISRCSAPARLFVQKEPGGSSETLTDLSGRSYLSLKSAFRYQKSVVKNCRCRAQPWSIAERDRHRLYASARRATATTVPSVAWIARDIPDTTATASIIAASAAGEVVTAGTGHDWAIVAQVSKTSPSLPTWTLSDGGSIQLAEKLHRTTVIADLELRFPSTVATLAVPLPERSPTKSVDPSNLPPGLFAAATIAEWQATQARETVQVAGWKRRPARYRRGLSADQILRHNIDLRF